MSEIGNRILSLKFNHSNTMLYIGTSQGLRIARLEDSKIISRRDRLNSVHFPGGFKQVVPLHDSQKIAVIGSKSLPKFKETDLHLWDEYHASFTKLFEFPSAIKNLIARRDYFAVVLENTVFFKQVSIYGLPSWKLVGNIETGQNPNGVGALSQTGPLLLLVPGPVTGHLRLGNLTASTFLSAAIHENPINCVSLSHDGKTGASSSEYGTVIRVFAAETLQIMHELRRGTISATISSLCFSKDASFLIAASNKSTVHIWNLDILNESGKGFWMLPTYFQYQRSYFKIRVKPEYCWVCEDTSQTGPSVCMTEENVVYVAHLDGNVYCYYISNADPELKSVFTFLDFEEEVVEDDREWTSLE
jgi:WD repeat-containing protein 45